MSRGTLLIFSGPSGVGKSTVIARLLRDDPNLFFSVSVTTRAIRPSETDGVNYHFISRAQFDEMVRNQELLEHAEYVSSCYGTPAAPIDRALDEGRNVILDIEVQGAAQVKAKRPDAVMVFIAAPSFTELERRLTCRGDTDAETAKKRMEAAREEYRHAPSYDYIVINDDLDHAAGELQAIMAAEKCRAAYRLGYLKEEE